MYTIITKIIELYNGSVVVELPFVLLPAFKYSLFPPPQSLQSSFEIQIFRDKIKDFCDDCVNRLMMVEKTETWF
jgi:hypothetical protein